MNYPNESLWITKPYNANRGINLKIVKDITKFKEDFLNTKRFNLGKYITSLGNIDAKESSETNQNGEDQTVYKVRDKVIIQKYIEKPLLLQNKKFDIR